MVTFHDNIYPHYSASDDPRAFTLTPKQQLHYSMCTDFSPTLLGEEKMHMVRPLKSAWGQWSSHWDPSTFLLLASWYSGPIKREKKRVRATQRTWLFPYILIDSRMIYAPGRTNLNFFGGKHDFFCMLGRLGSRVLCHMLSSVIGRISLPIMYSTYSRNLVSSHIAFLPIYLPSWLTSPTRVNGLPSSLTRFCPHHLVNIDR